MTVITLNFTTETVNLDILAFNDTPVFLPILMVL